ncbi:histone deacetylase complex subunit SAP30 isoform X2 [Gopherus evgoodei]|uniref:histone deacetylase complex subunit SAP30 isoform X2 n=1 Tax=Gopherus evgoodei TaxID=1825980 RepID=UPI0011CF0C4D|nr:histone deacetylase complex subunit SAP30 isoform X2 [Gopherus evgoodei]
MFVWLTLVRAAHLAAPPRVVMLRVSLCHRVFRLAAIRLFAVLLCLSEKSPQACVTVRRQVEPLSPFPSLLRQKHPLARHLYICDFHKNLIQSVRNRRKRKGSDDDGDSPVQDIDTPEVDLYQLQVNTLRRYKRHFKLQTRPGLNKAQLVEIIGCHFRTIPVNEKDTLTYFIYSVKNDKNKPDLKMDSGVH